MSDAPMTSSTPMSHRDDVSPAATPDGDEYTVAQEVPLTPADEELGSDRRGETLTLKDKLMGAALWAAGASWMLPVAGTMTLLQQFMNADRIDWLSRFYCWGQILLTGSRWRAVVHPDVDADTVYMFAQNHVNHFDYVTMYRSTPHFKQGLELETHFKYPLYGQFMKSRGTIPVPASRKRRLHEIREGIRREMERRHSVLVFPEGTRTLDGRVGSFRRGVFLIARDLGLPIVPVAITGMYDVMRKGSWVIRPGHTVTVYVEKPIPTAGLSDAEVAEVMERTRAIIAARVDEYYRRTRARRAG